MLNGAAKGWNGLTILSFQTICDWNSWIQVLFYFFLKHHLKTLNKEKCDLTHVVLVIILQIFVKNTYGLVFVAFSNIFSRLLFVLNHIVLSSTLYKFPQKALFFLIFIKTVFLYLYAPS